jgi:hypothetical protein
MAKRNTASHSAKRIVRGILIGLAIIVLCGTFDAPTRLALNLATTAAQQTLVMLPSFAQTAWQSLHSSSGDPQPFSVCAVEVLILWPLVATAAKLV